MGGRLAPERIHEKIRSVPYWHHEIEVAPGIVTPGASFSSQLLARLRLPDDLSGKRALDIGARDGHFSFELERRGAEVLAVDHVAPDSTGFAVAKELLGSQVECLHANFFELSPESVGRFDIVLFLGVLYHLRDPLAGLDAVRALCRERLYLETHVCDEEVRSESPIMRFYPADALNHDFTNYWGPNLRCVEAMLAESGFEVVRSVRTGSRAVLECRTVESERVDYYRRIAQGRVE